MDKTAILERAKKIVNAIQTRERLLSRSDWTQLPNSSVDSAAWETYRQALRDITEQPNYPFEIEWPTAPVKEVE